MRAFATAEELATVEITIDLKANPFHSQKIGFWQCGQRFIGDRFHSHLLTPAIDIVTEGSATLEDGQVAFRLWVSGDTQVHATHRGHWKFDPPFREFITQLRGGGRFRLCPAGSEPL